VIFARGFEESGQARLGRCFAFELKIVIHVGATGDESMDCRSVGQDSLP
jgi:hypothetical protein